MPSARFAIPRTEQRSLKTKAKNMKWKKWLENWDMTSLKVNLKFLEMEWQPKEPDKNAAWELYIEMLTRITTQHLQPEHGDEKTTLASIYNLFPLTRELIKRHGRDCFEFTKIAVVVLNQVVRPFTEKWHKESLKSAFKKKKNAPSSAANCTTTS